MNSNHAPNLVLALAGLCVPWSAAWSQTAPAPATTTTPVATTPVAVGAPGQIVQVEERVDRNEPQVVHTVIEDGGSKIDELIVRGQVQHVVVTPKVGTTKSYEIIVGRGGRESVDGTGGATSAVGKRVWNVLAF